MPTSNLLRPGNLVHLYFFPGQKSVLNVEVTSSAPYTELIMDSNISDLGTLQKKRPSSTAASRSIAVGKLSAMETSQLILLGSTILPARRRILS